MQTTTEILLEQVEIPEDIQAQLQKQTVRREMLDKYGEKAFLIPEELKFPVVNPSTGEFDVRLIYIAYLKSKEYETEQPSYKAISEKAKKLFIDNNGPEVLGDVGVEESLMGDLLELGLKKIIGEKKLTDLKTNPTCRCPNCKFECALGQYDRCSLQPCPVCDFFMESPTSEPTCESVEDKFADLVTETVEVSKGNPGDKFICKHCNTIIDYKVKETFEITKCPLCKKENMLLMFEDIDLTNKKYKKCPNCDSIFEYDRTRELDCCMICGQYFITLGKSK